MNRRVLLALVFAVLAAVALMPGEHTGSDALVVGTASSKLCGGGPLDRPRPGCAPPAPRSTGDPHEDCVARINQLRRECQCLPPLKRWKRGEPCANRMAKHDSKHGIHAGFNRDVCQPTGRAQNECPAWPSAGDANDGCLQRMWDEGPGRRFSKHGHYRNMSSTRYQRVACGFARTPNGDVWTVQNFE